MANYVSWHDFKAEMDARDREQMTPWQYRRHRVRMFFYGRRAAMKFAWQRAVGLVIRWLQKLCGHDVCQIVAVRRDDDDHVWVAICDFCGDLEVTDDEDDEMYDEAQRRIHDMDLDGEAK